MQKNVLQIIWVSLLLGFISMIFFLSVLVHLPFIITILLVIAFGYFSYRWINKYVGAGDVSALSKPYVIWSYVILLAGIFILTNKGYYIETEYGSWDAYVMWNYRALFLQFPQYAKFLFDKHSFVTHADYPLYLTGSIAFLRQLFSTDNPIISFTIGYFFTLAIPVSIYLALYRKNLPVATLALFFIITNELYIDHGLAQYADVPLGFLLLCVFICIGHVQKQRSVVVIIAALLGCCMWMKNEGVMLSLIFILFNVRILFTQGRWKYFLTGIIFPLITLAIFKNITPATDLVAGQNAKTGSYIFDASRYKLIWQYLENNFNSNFLTLKIGLVFYAVFCFVEKKLPSKSMMILLCCIAGFFFVYVLTPLPLEWHLQTSIDRLLMQLMPSFMYVLALRFCNLKFSLAGKKLQ